MTESGLFIPETELVTPKQKELVIAGDKGPCIGVDMALDTTTLVLDLVKKREFVYANHDPVHNKPILEEYIERGLRIEPDIEKVPKDSIYIFSAHGALPSAFKKANELNLIPVNVECTYVTKDRRNIEKAIKDGYHVVFLGSKPKDNDTDTYSWHPEPLATLGDLDLDDYTLLNVKNDENITEKEIDEEDHAVEHIPIDKPIQLFSQTTLSTIQIERKKLELEKKLGRSLGDIEGICYATDNRQTAVREGIFGDPDNHPDSYIVIGSKTSNNSNELIGIGHGFIGQENVHQIDTAEELRDEWIFAANRVGLTSGASVLNRFTEPAIEWFRDRGYKITMQPSTENENAFLRGPNLDLVKEHLARKYS